LSCFLTDQFDKVKKYYRESLQAEEKCNASVLGPVEQSKVTRANTEDLLNANRDAFLQNLAAQNRSLKELQEKAFDLDEKTHHLSNKVSSAGSSTHLSTILTT